MNPQAMNKGYRRLFWGTFFMMLWDGSSPALPFVPGIIGLCCCLSGTGMIFAVTDNRRFFLARRWTQIGIGIWILQILIVVPFFIERIPWELRFVSYFLSAVVLIQIYSHILIGAGEILDGGRQPYYARRAAVFAGVCALSTIGLMAEEVFGGFEVAISGWNINLLLLLYLVLALWIMHLMAVLRRGYPILLQ